LLKKETINLKKDRTSKDENADLFESKTLNDKGEYIKPSIKKYDNPTMIDDLYSMNALAKISCEFIRDKEGVILWSPPLKHSCCFYLSTFIIIMNDENLTEEEFTELRTKMNDAKKHQSKQEFSKLYSFYFTYVM
jgi:hypothetical protein